MTERKFTRGLNKPGMAAQLRENISQVVRESASLSKPVLVEPIDFEGFIAKNKTLIQNDPQRELLLYPSDDVTEVTLPKKFRTVTSNIPSFAALPSVPSSPSNGSANGNNHPSSPQATGKAATPPGWGNLQGHLLTRQALHTYESANHLIHYKYSAYGGTCLDLPR
ncbi:hypothetical protein quinque_010688 [Culex quinquefasciatus]